MSAKSRARDNVRASIADTIADAAAGRRELPVSAAKLAGSSYVDPALPDADLWTVRVGGLAVVVAAAGPLEAIARVLRYLEPSLDR